MSKHTQVDHLKIVLANSYALYLKTQNYHWNIESTNFYSLHLLLEKQYKELAEAIDLIAELIRNYGEKVEANFSFFASHCSIKEGNANHDAKMMIKELADDNVKIQGILQAAIENAQHVKDEVCASLMIDRMTAHRSAAWMLKSSL